MKALRATGLILFLTGLGLFLGLFFMSSYTLTEEIFTSTIKEEHQEALRPALSGFFGEAYSVSIPFVNDMKGAIEKVNEEFRAAQAWDKVIYDDYISALTRASTKGLITSHTLILLILIFGLGTIGAMLFILPQVKLTAPGIKNNGIFHNALNNRGWIGMLIGILLITFYVLLYFYDAYIMNWIILVDPAQKLINPDAQSSQWFLYGFLYTFAILVMGVRMIIKYRHSKYQIIRTISVMFFQLAFAFLIPEILVRLNQPYFDFKNMWPLDYDFFDAWHINMLTTSGGLGLFMFAWGITLFVIGVPVFVFFFRKEMVLLMGVRLWWPSRNCW